MCFLAILVNEFEWEKLFKISGVHLTHKIQMPHMVTSARLISMPRSMYEPILSKVVGAALSGQNFQKKTKKTTPVGLNPGFCMPLCLS